MTTIRQHVCVGTLGLLALGAGLTGCLPDDNRPEPGALTVTVTGEKPFASGPTEDGYTITFEKLLLSAGDSSFEQGDDDCSVYSNAYYGRIFNGLWTTPEKLSLLHAVGRCRFSFRVSSPGPDALLSEGTTEFDKTLMRMPGIDPDGAVDGIALLVVGKATQGGTSKHFAWAFRQPLGYSDCSLPGQSVEESRLKLDSGNSESLNLNIRVERLFSCDGDPTIASTCFAPFAEADDAFGNGDGEVTFEELALVPFTSSPDRKTWLEVLYSLMPHTVEYQDGGTCFTKVVRYGQHGRD